MEGMDLQNFVADSISQICHGIVDAQKSVESLGAIVSPRSMLDNMGQPTLVANGNPVSRPFLLNFDLALTVETARDSSKDGSKKAAIKIATASLGFEHSDGTASSKTDTQSVISHLSFAIPVIWPMHDASKFLESKSFLFNVEHESKWPEGAM